MSLFEFNFDLGLLVPEVLRQFLIDRTSVVTVVFGVVTIITDLTAFASRSAGPSFAILVLWLLSVWAFLIAAPVFTNLHETGLLLGFSLLWLIYLLAISSRAPPLAMLSLIGSNLIALYAWVFYSFWIVAICGKSGLLSKCAEAA